MQNASLPSTKLKLRSRLHKQKSKRNRKKVSSQDQVQNTFTLSQNYIKAVKSIRSGSSSQLTDEAKEVLYKEASVLKTTNNYISSKKDAERIYDINSIPKGCPSRAQLLHSRLNQSDRNKQELVQ